MRYNDYLGYIRANGTKLYPEKNEYVSGLMKDSYVRKMLATQFLTEGIIDKSLADILITKELIGNYI